MFASDELYIEADRPFPPLKDFGELPQIENGVGMVPSFLHRARWIKLDIKLSTDRFLVFTGVSFYPYLKRFVERLQKHGVRITAEPVENTFFGPTVTVTGLLTGRDVIKSMSKVKGQNNVLLIPDVALKNRETFLDDVTVRDVAEGLGMEARIIEATPDGLLKGMMDEN